MKRWLLLCLIFSAKTFAQTPPAHTVILILENHTYSEIVGNAAAPYINSLIGQPNTALFTQSFALTHPSQPNYLMLFSGANQGVTSDAVPTDVPFTTSNLGAALLQKGLSFTGYAEDLPSVGFTGTIDEIHGAYVRKHNPWVNWQESTMNGIPANLNRPFSDFPADYNSLPTLSIVIPNESNDMHDGTIAMADSWIQTHLDNYIQWCRNNNSLFILTFDEDDVSSNNQILTLFTGANIKGGSYNQTINHYSVLRTIEDLYGLPYAGASADAAPIQDIWLTALPLRLLQFNVSMIQHTVLISWIAQSTNEKNFTIERSTDNGQTWTTIATIAANNNAAAQTYNYYDGQPGAGKNLYRLKETDWDNHFTYSTILAIEVGKGAADAYIVYPNPAHDFVYIQSTKNNIENIMLQITDGKGNIVLKKNIVISSQLPVSLNLSMYPSGHYFVTVNGSANITTTHIVHQ